MTSYAHLTTLKHALSIGDDNDDPTLQRSLDAATGWIDQHTGRTFGDAVTATKLFYPSDDGRLDVVDLLTVTTLKVDSRGDRSYATTLAATDYELLPPNETPKQQVRLWPTSSKSFGPGRLVQIAGTWGYGSVPAQVEQACLILATRYYKRHEAPFGILGQADLGQFERISKEDPDVISLLAPYTRTRAWVLV